MTAVRRAYPEAARGLLRDTIIEAVDGLVRSRGWSATRMSDVAAAAGVSRQTVYNEFASRGALIEAYVRREVDALVAEVEASVRASHDDARGALRTAFALFLRLASDEPLVKVIVADANYGELMQLLTTLGRALAVTRITALITEVWPQADAADAEIVADTLTRLAISHALVPSVDADRAAEDVVRLLGPFVDDALA